MQLGIEARLANFGEPIGSQLCESGEVMIQLSAISSIDADGKATVNANRVALGPRKTATLGLHLIRLALAGVLTRRRG